MEKLGTKTKAVKKKYETITIDCDDSTIERLKGIALRAGVTVSQVVSVMLAAYMVEDEGA